LKIVYSVGKWTNILIPPRSVFNFGADLKSNMAAMESSYIGYTNMLETVILKV